MPLLLPASSNALVVSSFSSSALFPGGFLFLVTRSSIAATSSDALVTSSF